MSNFSLDFFEIDHVWLKVKQKGVNFEPNVSYSNVWHVPGSSPYILAGVYVTVK